MQKTELINLALDCELCIAQFTDAKLTTIFERADQVNDTLYRDERTGVEKGGSAKMGDHGLEMHDLCECLCMIAVACATPTYGTGTCFGREANAGLPLALCLG